MLSSSSPLPSRLHTAPTDLWGGREKKERERANIRKKRTQLLEQLCALFVASEQRREVKYDTV